MVAKTAPIPNIRKQFVPDPGHIIMEWDLDRADAQIVAWDAGDEKLKAVLRAGKDVHQSNAEDLFKLNMEELKATNPIKYSRLRHAAKTGVHAVNYYVQARTLAREMTSQAGLGPFNTARAQAFIDTWLEAHPAIADWHEDIYYQLQSTGMIYNKFGYRRIFFDRLTIKAKQEALAWIPQSTVALVINRGWDMVARYLPKVKVLLQVHDSLVLQTPYYNFPRCVPQITECLEVTVPYDDPLVIPVGCKWSDKSWGDCKEWKG